MRNPPNKSVLHSGHRERVKQSFMSDGGSYVADHELLELLLFFSIPRVDTNETAHRLINECGSLSKAVYASPEKLLSVEGVGQNTVVFFEAIKELFKRLQMQRFSPDTTFDNLHAVGEYLVKYFYGYKDERLCAMLFDSGMHLIETVTLSHGSSNGTVFDPRSLARTALLRDATRVIISHNHPGGVAFAGAHDRSITAMAEAALSAVNILLVEHIIVSDVAYMPTMQTRMHSVRSANDPNASFFKSFYSLNRQG